MPLIALMSVDRSSLQSGQTINATLTLTQPNTPITPVALTGLQLLVSPSTPATLGTPGLLPQTIGASAGNQIQVTWALQLYSSGGSGSPNPLAFTISCVAQFADGTTLAAPLTCGAVVWPVRETEVNELPVILPGPGLMLGDSNLNSALLLPL